LTLSARGDLTDRLRDLAGRLAGLLGSEVEDICWEAAPTEPAVLLTSPISELRVSKVRLYAP
jgi:hypothetical protein